MTSRPQLAAAGRPSASRTITVDYLTAAGHPDAVVTGALLLVIVVLVLVGLVGLLEPVVSLDLFRPDAPFGLQLRMLAQIGVSVLALVTAGLGLAKHPRFPALFFAVAGGLTLLFTIAASRWLVGGELLAAFPLVAVPAVLAVPYVALSRRCRLIFHQRMTMDDVRPEGDADWAIPVTFAAQAPVLPSPDGGKAAPAPKRQRARKAVAGAETGGRRGGALTGAANPPADPNSAALWAVLYGAPAHDERHLLEEDGASPELGHGGTPARKRVGLEALINLRPPGA